METQVLTDSNTVAVNIETLNGKFSNSPAEEIVEWVLQEIAENPICTTNFRPWEPVILHLLTRVMPDLPILWIDTGCLLAETYRFAKEVTEALSLNLKIYTPIMTEARRRALYGEIPSSDHKEDHELFSEHVKLEPFRRAMKEMSPDVWFTAIRKSQTEFRQSLSLFSRGQDGILKVAPLFNWSLEDLESYSKEHDLPSELVYSDPTKPNERGECGIHLPR